MSEAAKVILPKPTPSQLHAWISEIVTEETGCTVSWAQHPEPCRQEELRQIERRLRLLLAEIQQ